MRIEGAGEALETWIYEDDTQAQLGCIVNGAEAALRQDYGLKVGQWMQIWVPTKTGHVYVVRIELVGEGHKEGVI